MTISRIAALCAAAAVAHAAGIPSGTELEIRLESSVSSNQSKPHDPVNAVLIRPVVLAGNVVVPAGAKVNGVVKDAVAVKSATDRAALELTFSKLEPAGAPPVEIHTKLREVDNSRETVSDDGRIVGILSSETLAARIRAGVDRVGQKYAGLGDVLDTVRAAVLKEPEPEIVYGPGVEMKLVLTAPLEAAVSGSTPTVQAVTPAQAVFDLANRQPVQTTTEVGDVPSDLTNLMFLGTAEQLAAAFKASGWAPAAHLDTASGLEVFRAVAEMRGYKEAPMSVLLLDRRQPDLVFEKQNNTFAKRHHLRIWKRPGDFQGHPVWMCAATHDIGIEFSAEHRNFIHKIDSEIDRERAKVVNDLVFGGHVTGLSLVDRPTAPHNSQNATGDKLETDGKLAVLLLN